MKKNLSKYQKDYFRKILAEVRRNSRFDITENFIQHGTTTVKKHCIDVAQTAYFISLKLGLRVDTDSLIRGALLHDYFLYDWHEFSLRNCIHGYLHPGIALNEASKDFALTRIEKDMIKHHMFPLTIFRPRTKEGWILCLADKLVATRETLEGKK